MKRQKKGKKERDSLPGNKDLMPGRTVVGALDIVKKSKMRTWNGKRETGDERELGLYIGREAMR